MDRMSNVKTVNSESGSGARRGVYTYSSSYKLIASLCCYYRHCVNQRAVIISRLTLRETPQSKTDCIT